MLNVYVANIILNKKDKTRTLQLQQLQQQQQLQKHNIAKDKKTTNKSVCAHCGQQLPWFCVCYLHKKL